MAVVGRSSGTFNTVTGFSVTPQGATFTSGNTVVVIVFGNTVVSTPGSMTQRATSVVDLGLYAYDKTGAGESSIAFTNSSGSGTWHAWELSSGSAFLSPASAIQTSAGNTTYTTGTLTPTAGARHLLAAVGGVGGVAARTVTAFSDSFTERADLQVTAQDWPFAGFADRDVTADGVTAYSTTATFSGATATARGAVLLAYSAIVGDTTPPSVPAGLATTAIGSTTVDLSWSAATDDTAVTGYELQVIGP
jgi:hypothetical protein